MNENQNIAITNRIVKLLDYIAAIYGSCEEDEPVATMKWYYNKIRKTGEKPHTNKALIKACDKIIKVAQRYKDTLVD